MCRVILLSERPLQHFKDVGEEIEREVSDFIGVVLDICHDTAQRPVFQGLHGSIDEQIDVYSPCAGKAHSVRGGMKGALEILRNS